MTGENPAPVLAEAAAGLASHALVIGCGNLLRGDDAAGPEFVRRLAGRELPAGVRCLDAGTGGIDVAFAIRGVPEVILIDACRTGSEPGSLFELPAEELLSLPPPEGLGLHDFRWHHALAAGRWLFGDEPPRQVTAFLIEGGAFEAGASLSPAVDRALDVLADLLVARLAAAARATPAAAAGSPAGA
jgi:hydrogenase maturation protease